MKIKVYYPSGNNFLLSGEWKGPGNIEGSNVIVIMLNTDSVLPGNNLVTAGAAFIGDPRGVYIDNDNKTVLYNPRDYMEGMQKVWIDWLNEHSDWPALLEL